jgi:hypothetical protein
MTHPRRIYKGSGKQVGFRTAHETILQQESRSPKEVAYMGQQGETQKKKKGGKKNPMWGSAVKSTECSFRDPEFNSQQPHGGSQPSVMRSDALFWCV